MVSPKNTKQRNVSRAYTSEPDANEFAASLMEANHRESDKKDLTFNPIIVFNHTKTSILEFCVGQLR